MPRVASAIKKTTNYGMFKFMDANRDVIRSHVDKLKEAFNAIGNLTQVQPILVNERYEIIDGQNRFVAAMELGEPIYYTIYEGLGIRDARTMNILHRGWAVMDFARSYAETGNENYQIYLNLREAYGYGHTITLLFALGSMERGGSFNAFREGRFVVPGVAGAVDRLAKLQQMFEAAPQVGKDKNYAQAFLKILTSEREDQGGYDHDRMLTKLQATGATILKKFATQAEYMRALEEVYNHRLSQRNRVYLF